MVVIQKLLAGHYLKLQGCFRHLFEPTVQKDTLAHIQATVNAYWDWVQQGHSV